MLIQSHEATSRHQPLPPAWFEPASVPPGYAVLDHLQVAIAILDPQGTILFCNVRAQQLARDSGLFNLGEGRRLRFLEGEAERKFRAALAGFANRSPSEREASVTIVFGRSSACDHPLIATLHPLADNAATILMTLTDSRCSLSETRLQCFMQAFGLTPAEQRLTHHLVTGGCLRDAAKSFGLSCHTVRNQLRSIFEKVGVQRQTDLARLMLAGSAFGGIA